jgi:hypothetical protein
MLRTVFEKEIYTVGGFSGLEGTETFAFASDYLKFYSDVNR